MQNRLVLTGLPSSVPRLPRARESLRDLVEDHACWVDRLAFVDATPLGAATVSDGRVAAAVVELHVENVRDKAIRALDGMAVSMDREGLLVDDPDSMAAHGDNDIVTFRIQAHAANRAQSTALARVPLPCDDVSGEKKMDRQLLHLPLTRPLSMGSDSNAIALTVRKSEEHGGTGTYPWRGGWILARQICHWASAAAAADRDPSVNTAEAGSPIADPFELLFSGGNKIMELGAGAAGLPSMALGKIDKTPFHRERYVSNSLIASDGIDEIVTALQVNVRENGLGDCIDVRHINWNDYARTGGSDTAASTREMDTIIFADCVYNDEGAAALTQAISHLLKPGGHVVGVLPDFRVGTDVLERSMRANKFVPIDMPIIATEGGSFACSGGSGKEYRLVLWRHSNGKDQNIGL